MFGLDRLPGWMFDWSFILGTIGLLLALIVLVLLGRGKPGD